MNSWIDALRKMGSERVLINEPMALHTTYRVGGPADVVFFPASEEETAAAVQIAKENNIPCHVFGNGSNLIVRDGGIRGLVIILGEHFSGVRVEGNRIYAQAGASLSRVATAALNASLTGLEFASGIPGSLGGGCAMNAGAYGGQLSDVFVSARVLTESGIRELDKQQMEMGYRSTMPLKTGAVVLSAVFELTPGNAEEISAKMKDLNAKRRDKQPLNLPSAGSVFKRPEGNFAGALIEQSGLKGHTIGGAQVSEKHAGFIVNIGGATCADILALIRYVQETVNANFGVMLELEQQIVGED